MVLENDSDDSETIQVLFSVSKKKIKKAVHRNLIKRRMKEAYRLNKDILSDPQGSKKSIALIYVSSEISTFQVIQNKICKILSKVEELSKSRKTDS